MNLISFVIPCYKSVKTLQNVVEEIQQSMREQGERYEIILVNDCSPDDTFLVIQQICDNDSGVIGINFAKNFGQHAALMAGLSRASGEIIICLDDDGQTPANEAYKLLDEIRQGRDVVYARYPQKKHSWGRNMGSILNEWMLRWLLSKPKDLSITSYFAARRFVVQEILNYNSPYPYLAGLILRTTSNISNVFVTHRKRLEGTSGYNLGKLVSLWLNGFTSFSVQPLRLSSLFGLILSVASIFAGIAVIINKILNPSTPLGWSSMICVTVFLGGIIMIMLGLIGEYLGRLYISQNKSPQYVVREIIGQRKSDDLNN